MIIQFNVFSLRKLNPMSPLVRNVDTCFIWVGQERNVHLLWHTGCTVCRLGKMLRAAIVMLQINSVYFLTFTFAVLPFISNGFAWEEAFTYFSSRFAKCYLGIFYELCSKTIIWRQKIKKNRGDQTGSLENTNFFHIYWWHFLSSDMKVQLYSCNASVRRV